MKIYDCFTFYNEFDLLELRLEELFDSVDHFIIAEANTTHSGNPKDYLLLDNWDRFKPYADKIIHIKVEDMPGVIDNNCWHNERHQRNCLARGLVNCRGNDIVILSDVDEMVRSSCIEFIRNDKLHNLWAFRMPFFNFRFNYMWVSPLIYQVQGQAFTVERAATFRNFTQIREIYGANWANRPVIYDDGTEICLQHSGWHFSSLGDTSFVANKLRNFAHNEKAHQADTLDVDNLIANNKTNIIPDARFEAVVLDDYFPEYLVKNKERFNHLIIDNATDTIRNKLKSVI